MNILTTFYDRRFRIKCNVKKKWFKVAQNCNVYHEIFKQIESEKKRFLIFLQLRLRFRLSFLNTSKLQRMHMPGRRKQTKSTILLFFFLVRKETQELRTNFFSRTSFQYAFDTELGKITCISPRINPSLRLCRQNFSIRDDRKISSPMLFRIVRFKRTKKRNKRQQTSDMNIRHLLRVGMLHYAVVNVNKLKFLLLDSLYVTWFMDCLGLPSA